MMKVAIVIVWILLGASYFLIWQSSKGNCCDKALDALSYEESPISSVGEREQLFIQYCSEEAIDPDLSNPQVILSLN